VTLLAAGAYFYFLRRGDGRMPAPPLPSWLETQTPESLAGPTETPGPPTPTPGPTLTPAAEETLDDLVRRVVAGLTSHPQVVKLLATPGLVRRFVVSVDNVAEGKSPRQNLIALDPRDDFAVSQRGERIYVSPKSYERYDAVADAIASIDVNGVAAAFAELEPRLDQEYRELGYPNRRFREVLSRALERLEGVPVPTEKVELRPKVKSYRFADPKLEKLAPAEKHLVRMGPENAKRVQAKLRELRTALGE
jgi:hypothetical protein